MFSLSFIMFILVWERALFSWKGSFPREADVWKHTGTTSPSTVCYKKYMLSSVCAEKALARCFKVCQTGGGSAGCWEHRCENFNRSDGLGLEF